MSEYLSFSGQVAETLRFWRTQCILNFIFRLSTNLSDETLLQIIKLHRGSKQIRIDLDNKQIFHTYIKNTSKQKVKGETTACYVAIRKCIQAIANRRNQAYQYEFRTQNPNMMKWALTHGKEVFGYTSGDLETELLLDKLDSSTQLYCQFTVIIKPSREIN